MGESSLLDTIKGQIGHYISSDISQGETSMQDEVIFEQQEIEEQAADGEPLTIALDNQDQAEISTRRSSSRSGNALETYGTWANYFLLKDNDIIEEQEDKYALILEEEKLSLLNKAQACEAKFEWNATMEREMQSLEDNKIWELVKHPQDQSIVNCKWL
jgi:hypothetical protein